MTGNTGRRQSFRIRRISRKTVKNGLSESRRLYLRLSLVTAAGLFMGAYSCMAADRFPVFEGGRGFAADFLSSLSVMAVYMAVCFFSGLSPAGAPVGYAICLFKGMGAGAMTAGIAFGNALSADILLGVLPFEAVGTAAVIFAARESLRLSELVSGSVYGKGTECGKDCIRLYITKFFVISLAAAFAALMDGLLPVMAAKGPVMFFV